MRPDQDLVAGLLDGLLPGDGVFPPARATDLAARIAAHDRFGPTLAPVLGLLPDDFLARDPAAQVAALRAVEQAAPDAFAALVTGAYSLYYTHPAVAGVIAALAGAPPGPPQPEGYDVAPFDPALVAIPAARGPLYRDAPEVSQ